MKTRAGRKDKMMNHAQYLRVLIATLLTLLLGIAAVNAVHAGSYVFIGLEIAFFTTIPALVIDVHIIRGTRNKAGCELIHRLGLAFRYRRFLYGILTAQALFFGWVLVRDFTAQRINLAGLLLGLAGFSLTPVLGLYLAEKAWLQHESRHHTQPGNKNTSRLQ